MAAGAARVGAMQLHGLAQAHICACLWWSLRAAGTGGGGAGGSPRRLSRTHFPRFTTEVRFGGEVTVRRLACPSRPAAIGESSSSTRRNCEPVNPRYPVVFGEAVVEERIPGRLAIPWRGHFRFSMAVEEQFGFLLHARAETFVEVGKNERVRVGTLATFRM